MLQNIAAIAGIGSFIVSLVALLWAKSNSDKIKQLSVRINSDNIKAKDVNSKNQNVTGDGNLTGGGDVSVNSKG